jgi:hypothetical protein
MTGLPLKPTQPSTPKRRVSVTQAMKLTQKALGGDAKAITRVRSIIETDATIRGVLVERLGEPGRLLEIKFARRCAAGCALSEAMMLERAEDLRRELTPSNASALEKLMVSRVLVTHLAVNAAELAADRAVGYSAEVTKLLEVTLDRAHRRLMSAVRTLAWLRRSPPPAVAVQVNVAGATAPPPASLPVPATSETIVTGPSKPKFKVNSKPPTGRTPGKI